MCSKEPKLPHTHNLRSGLEVTIYAHYLELAICAHDLRSRSALMTWRSPSDTHYRHRLRSRSGTHYLRSRSTLAVCAHDQSRATSWRPIPTNLRMIYAIVVMFCIACTFCFPFPSSVLSRYCSSSPQSPTLNCSQPLSMVIQEITCHSTKKSYFLFRSKDSPIRWKNKVHWTRWSQLHSWRKLWHSRSHCFLPQSCYGRTQKV